MKGGRNTRQQAFRMIQRLGALPGRLHRDESGQMVVIAAALLLILVMALAVPVRLSLAVRQKIQAQNAADAAAITGGIWQLRGLNIVQGMNDLVFLCDALSLTGLTISAVLGPCVATPVVGQAVVLPAGWLSLGLSTASHFASQCLLIPLRDVVAHGWSVACYIGASESARLNEASPMFGAMTAFLEGITGQLLDANLPINLPTAGDVGQVINNHHDESKDEGFIRKLCNQVADMPIYAFGLEMRLESGSGNTENKVGVVEMIGRAIQGDGVPVLPMWLHVIRTQATRSNEAMPLRVEDALVHGLLTAAQPLVPVAQWANVYFTQGAPTVNGALDAFFGVNGEGGGLNPWFLSFEVTKEDASSEDTTEAEEEAMENQESWFEDAVADAAAELTDAKWNHPWYEMAESREGKVSVLPTVTWVAVVRDQKEFRMTLWDRLGGLGVRRFSETVKGNSLQYDELGGMALSAAALASEPVRMVRFGGINGWVMLRPVKILKDKEDARDFGICH